MQVQAPPTYAPNGTPDRGVGLFNAFYEATSPIAFDFASGLIAQSNDVAVVVARAYEDIQRSHETVGAPYHAVPLLAEIFGLSASCPRPPAGALKPGADAVQALGEPHRSILYLMERHNFSATNTAAILGLETSAVAVAHEDARAVAHGVSAALALCPGGQASCPALAAELDPGAAVIPQTERILDHAERCNFCMATALASPDPIKELRHCGPVSGGAGAAPLAPTGPIAAQPGPGPESRNGQGGTGAGGQGVGSFGFGATAIPAAVAAWSAAPAGVSPLPSPGPGPTLAPKAAPEKKGWSPLLLWNKATGWQRSGAIMAALLIAALVVAITAGGDGEDVAARTNGSPGTSTQANGANGTVPMPTLPAPNNTAPTTEPITTLPGSGDAPSTSTYAGPGSSPQYPYSSGSSSPSSGSGNSSGPSSIQPPPGPPETTPPPTTAPPTTVPAPQVTSYTWSPSRNLNTTTAPWSRDIDLHFASTGTSITYTTSWGKSGNLLSGTGTLSLQGVPLGNQSVMLTINGPGGASATSFQTPMF